jgi:YVTN family beta-propeller protein
VPARSPLRIWLRRLSLIGSFALLVVSLVGALGNMSLIHQNGNFPSTNLLLALIVSLLLWLAAIALGWWWRRRLYLLIWVLAPIWLVANYGTVVGACHTCMWEQGAEVAHMRLGQFDYVGWRVVTRAQMLVVNDGRVWMPDFDGSGIWAYSASTGQAYLGNWSGFFELGKNPLSIASYGGRLWIVSPTTGMLYEVDPKRQLFKAVVATHPLGGHPFVIAAGSDSLWIINRATARLVRFDPVAGRIAAEIKVGRGPNYILVANDGALWVSNYQDNTLSHIDPSTNEVVETIPVGSGPGFLLETQGTIWCSNETGHSLSKLDLATKKVTEVQVGDTPLGLASADGYLWVANIKSKDIWLIDASTDQVIRTLNIGVEPWSFAVDGNTVWVATYSDGVLARITTR